MLKTAATASTISTSPSDNGYGFGAPGKTEAVPSRSWYHGISSMITLRNPWRLAAVAVCAVGAISLLRAQQPQFQAGGAAGVPQTARLDNSPNLGAENPLGRAIDLASAALDQSRRLNDYSFTMVKRERIDGKLCEKHEAVQMKIRRQPFSIYCKTLGPIQPKDQEAIYVEGRNNGKVAAHTTGFRHRLVGMLLLDPSSPEMMEGSRYPMTTAGFENMLTSMIEMYRGVAKFPENQVRLYTGAKVDGRSCTCVELSHTARRKEFPFAMCRVFYDDEMGLPIRWEAYDWPAQAGGEPQLAEEYTYRNLQLNPGLTDGDFDPKNPQYGYN